MISGLPRPALLFSAFLIGTAVQGQGACEGFGPQTPRDITEDTGTNTQLFPLAPPSTQMNLCNIHTHTNAEHRGPGFTVSAGDGVHGGFQCDDTENLTEAQMAMPKGLEPAIRNVVPGDTIEVHWVHTSCQVSPGPGLESCLSDACANPTLRVETQVFLVVNDETALDFNDFTYGGNVVDGFHQPKAIPDNTGEPVVFRGSTTGPSFSEASCSPLQVTWSVRPQCARLSYQSLNAWAANGNVFEEDSSHGIRALVTTPELLAPLN